MGARLGRYTVLKHLATGGMADVLLARTDGIEGFERHVVLKRIKPEHARDQRFIRMFLDEARVAANLHHQNIVQVHDIGEADGEYFIAMEYLHGEDVRTILSNASKTRAHVPLGHAIAIVSAAASGLHYAHERRSSDRQSLGFVHRDVSPSNILVCYDGSIKVVDFGIAKAATRQETRSGSLKGKISYMSPEQCRTDDIDRRSDVYSLGVVLYELATTTRLFKGDNDFLVMEQIVGGRLVPPRNRRADLPNELSNIILRALATDPELRYSTADELRIALDQFAEAAGITAAPSGIANYMRKQFGERPEPWLSLGDGSAEIELIGGTGGPSATSPGEHSRSGASHRSGSMPRASRPISVASDDAAPPARSAERPVMIRPPSMAPPTDSKMGWENQRSRTGTQRRFGPTTLAMIVAPLVVILGVAVWRMSGNGSSSVAAVVPAAPVVAVAPPPPAKVVPIDDMAPIPESPAEPAPRVTRSAEPAPKHVPPKRNARSEPAPTPAKSSAAAPVVPAPGAAAAPLTDAIPPMLVAPPPPAPVAVPAPPVAPVAPRPVETVARLGHAIIERVASEHGHELASCDTEELHGDLTVVFMIDASGAVIAAQAAAKLNSPKVVACIVAVFEKWRFPKQGPAGARGSYTVSFQ